MEEKDKRKNLTIGILIGVIICLVIALILISYNKFIMNNNSNSNSNSNNTNNNQSNEDNDSKYSNLIHISCNYDENGKVSQAAYNQECVAYNPTSLNKKYNLPNNHFITKIITDDNEIKFLVLSNGHEEADLEYHEYLYSIDEEKSYFKEDSYKHIAGLYTKNKVTNVILYDNNETYDEFKFKKINLKDSSIVTELRYSTNGFTNPEIISKNHKNYVVLTLASEFPDRLILTTDFKKIDIGLAYEGYELTEEGNIKIFVESHKYKVYDDTGKLISEGQY